MRILVTGTAGHLGEALVRTIQQSDNEVDGIDIKDSEYTHKWVPFLIANLWQSACKGWMLFFMLQPYINLM